MTTCNISDLVRQCHAGRSFASVRREHGYDVYRTVRDQCVAEGRGALTGEIVARDDRGGLTVQIGDLRR